jgi:hypothetical protein
MPARLTHSMYSDGSFEIVSRTCHGLAFVCVFYRDRKHLDYSLR